MFSRELVLIHYQDTEFWGSNNHGASFKCGHELVSGCGRQNGFGTICRTHQVMGLLSDEAISTCTVRIPSRNIAGVPNGSAGKRDQGLAIAEQTQERERDRTIILS
jgi:hypothetical protein